MLQLEEREDHYGLQAGQAWDKIKAFGLKIAPVVRKGAQIAGKMLEMNPETALAGRAIQQFTGYRASQAWKAPGTQSKPTKPQLQATTDPLGVDQDASAADLESMADVG